MARLVRMLAELVARLQLQHPQAGRGRLRVQRVQRLQRQRAARPLGGQEEQLVQAGLGRGRAAETRCPAFCRCRSAPAPAGSRHRAPCGRRPPPARAGRCGIRAESAVPPAPRRARPVRLLLPRPGQVALALRVEERLQLGRRMRLDQHGFLFGGDVEIHQRHRQAGQAARLAQQMAVDLGLRPVRGAVVLAHAVQASTIGLDLFQALGGGVVAVGAAAHQQFAVFAGQGNLGFIAGAAPAVTTPCPATPSWPVGAGVKRRSRSPARAVNSHSVRTAATQLIGLLPARRARRPCPASAHGRR